MRSAIARVGGKQDLTGWTDIQIEISNQCVRLIANAGLGGLRHQGRELRDDLRLPQLGPRAARFPLRPAGRARRPSGFNVLDDLRDGDLRVT